MLRPWVKLLKSVFWIGGGLLTFIVFLELFRIFIFFYQFRPLLGYIFAVTVALLMMGGVGYVMRLVLSIPRQLCAPDTGDDLSLVDDKVFKKYGSYATAYARRLRRNTALPASMKKGISSNIHQFEDRLYSAASRDEKMASLKQLEEVYIMPLRDELNKQSDHEISRCVRDVMIGVSLSPYHSMDLLIVLYRNLRMVIKIMRLYSSRPHAAEQVRILLDIVKVLATVNFMNLGRRLFDSLFANVPFVGGAVNEVGQGLGAGLFTSAAGHAAVMRCGVYGAWRYDEAYERFPAMSKVFLKDVKNIFVRDVLPDLRYRIQPEGVDDDPGTWESFRQGVSRALDTTMNAFDDFLVKPAVHTSRWVVGRPSRPATIPEKPAVVNIREKAPISRRGVFRAFNTFIGRIRYSPRDHY